MMAKVKTPMAQTESREISALEVKTDKMHRQKAGHDKHNGSKGKTEEQAVFLRIPDPLRVGCSVVEADEGLSAAADSQHR